MKKNLKIIIPAIVVVIVAIVGVLLVVNNNQQEQVKGTTEVVKTTKEDKTTTTEKETATEAESKTETKPVTEATQTITKAPETTKKPTTNSSGISSGSSTTTKKPTTTTTKPTTTKPATTKQEVIGYADPDKGIGWDGKPIVYHYPDGTTGNTPIDGAKYEYTPGIWRVLVVQDPTAVTYAPDLCAMGCGRKNQECDNRMHDWHCDVCNVDVKKWECHPLH